MGSPLWKLLDAVVKLPGAVIILEKAVNLIVLWYVSRQQRETLQQIATAAAVSARASTREERHAALDSWQRVLNRPRIRT